MLPPHPAFCTSKLIATFISHIWKSQEVFGSILRFLGVWTWRWQVGSVQNPQIPQRCEKIPLLLHFWCQQRPAKPNLSWQIEFECLASLGVTQKRRKERQVPDLPFHLSFWNDFLGTRPLFQQAPRWLLSSCKRQGGRWEAKRSGKSMPKWKK